MKKLFLSACMLLLAAVLLGTTTYAWFSMNRTVDAKGMNVKAKVDSSLVITEAALPNASTSTFAIEFASSSVKELYPSTHATDTTAFPSGLMTVSNLDKVDTQTGLAVVTDPATTLDYADAANGANASTDKQYYFDYYCFVASQGKDLTGQDLTIKLTNSSVSNINGAVSIDVYYITKVTKVTKPTIASTFAGTLNLAGLDSKTKDGKDVLTELIIENVTVPFVGTDPTKPEGAVAFMFRVYVDGALMKDSTHTFVNTAKASEISNQSLNINILSEDHKSSEERAKAKFASFAASKPTSYNAGDDIDLNWDIEGIEEVKWTVAPIEAVATLKKTLVYTAKALTKDTEVSLTATITYLDGTEEKTTSGTYKFTIKKNA